MRATRLLRLALIAALLSSSPAFAAEGRALTPNDVFSLKDVADPRLSPDGRQVAYTLTTLDAKEDDSDTDVYLVSTDGGEPLRLTSGKKPETSPRFSPNGEWIAFLSDREGKKKQVYLLNRKGGEAVKLTSYAADVSDLAWSPDSKRLALVVSDVDPDDDEAEDEEKKPGRRRRRRRSRSSCAGSSSSATARATSGTCASTSTSSTWRRRRPSR